MDFVDPQKNLKKQAQIEKKQKESENIKQKLMEERALRLAKIREKEQKKAERDDSDNTSNSTEEVAEDTSEHAQDESEDSKENNYSERKTVTVIPKKDDDANSARDNLKIKIKELEDQISKTKYNKKTQRAIGMMKAQLATLKTKLAGGAGKQGVQKDGYAVRKSGDATVVLLGFPSAGKSTLLNKLTNAESETGAYAFTTLTVIPGILEHKQAKIQILDVPGIVEGAASGTGRGKEVLQVIRNADLILMLIDGTQPFQKRKIEKEVYESHVRINQKKPDIKIRRMSKDGIRVGRTVETEVDDETVMAILKQFRIMNAEVLLRDPVTADQFIDCIENNKAYVPAITVVNKTDILSPEQKALAESLEPSLFIAAQQSQGLEELKDLIFDSLNFIRVYLKEINNKADMDEPLIMRKGATLKDVCAKLHKDFIKNFKFARIWGPSAKFDGQQLLKLNHTLQDQDVLEIHVR